MNAERLITLTDVVAKLPHDDPYWQSAQAELIEFNRALANAMDGWMKPVAHISLGQDWRSFAGPVHPLYDAKALLAVEMQGIEHIGRLREELAAAYIKLSGKERHASDCATSRAPAMDPGACDCNVAGVYEAAVRAIAAGAIRSKP